MPSGWKASLIRLRATALEAAPSAGTAADAGGLRTALLRARGTEQEFLVNRLCLRAMPQARYQTRNEGHFGLASQAYCHFTSPIRPLCGFDGCIAC